jgi:hypothetical protein
MNSLNSTDKSSKGDSPLSLERLSLSKILWNGALGISVILLGLWIGESISSESLINPPVLLALTLLAALVGPYLASGFTRMLVTFEYSFPLRFLVPLAVLYLGIQATFQWIERDLYWGEMFALLLLPAIGCVRYHHPGQKRMIQMAYFMLFMLPVYGILYTLLYWGDEYQTYFLLRHLAVFHYIIFFFAAYKHAEKFITVFTRFFWVPFLLIIPGLLRIPLLSYPYASFGLIGVPVLLAWCYLGYLHRCRSPRASLAGLLAYVTVIALLSLRSTNVMTIAMLLLLLPAVRFLRYWHQLVPLRVRRFALGSALVLILVGGGTMLHFLGKELQENILYKIDIMSIPETAGLNLGQMQDTYQTGSAMYRLSLWATYFNRFVEHPLGIGVGTKAFEASLVKVIPLGLDLNPDLEYQTYTVGAHNSFFTFLARFGIVFLIPFGVCAVVLTRMMSGYWRSCRYSPLSTAESRMVFGGIVAFLAVLIQASFNMVVETPLYAALFWFSLGLMTRLLGDYLAGEPSAVGDQRSLRRRGLKAR